MKNLKQNKYQQFLKYLSVFLLFFIPLYPKIPLADIIPGYIVRMRLEDIFISITVIFYFVGVLLKKLKFKSVISYIIFIYIFVSFLSTITAIFIFPTMPFEPVHIAKTSMHFIRYIEYFSLFFIFFASIESKKDINVFIYSFVIVSLLIAIYGYGQKYLYWPVYSTMNREFSKGVRLYLTEHARVQSTFGGHYDLGAFLVLSLSILMGLIFIVKKGFKKYILYITFLFNLWLLIMCASRTSVISFLFSSFVFILLYVFSKKLSLKNKVFKFFKYEVQFLFIFLFMFSVFGKDLQERYLQIIRGDPKLSKIYDSLPKSKTDFFVFFDKFKKQEPPENAIAFDNSEEKQQMELMNNLLTPSDERPTPNKPIENNKQDKGENNRPLDVYNQVDKIIRVSTQTATGTVYVTKTTTNTWSDCALKHSLSVCIRLEALWPNAIKGFMHNPLLGNGFATLNKKSFEEFTVAESTDNNFLRTLGEVGLLGFLSFYGTIFVMLIISFYFYKKGSYDEKMLAIIYISSTLGLLLNATYIDVFAASKVAEFYWAFVGVVLGYFYLSSLYKKIKLVETIENLADFVFFKLKKILDTKIE